jgi:hypothetical protein
MIKFQLRKVAIVLSSLAVLIDTAYARDGGFSYERSGLAPPSSHQSLTPAWLITYSLTEPASADHSAHRHGSAR